MSSRILLAFLFCLVTLSSACIIQNCPRGGKRSLPEAEIQQCTPCGPDNSGKCFGPNLCCPENQKCFRGPEVDRQCERECCLSSPCRNRRGLCRGQCQEGSRCCNDFTCFPDPCCS